MTISAALTFRTVFAIIPVMILAFLLLQSTGRVDESKEQLRHFLDEAGLSQIVVPDELLESGMDAEAKARYEAWLARQETRRNTTTRPGAASQPATHPTSQPATASEHPPLTATTAAAEDDEEAIRGTPLSDKIIAILDNAEKKLTFAKLGPVSLLLVAWSAITLLTTLERAMNRIFEAPRSRPIAIRVLLYWSAVTFLPLVMTAMTTLSAYAKRMLTGETVVEPWLASAMVLADFVLNMFLSTLALAAIYKFMPHTLVRFRHAVTAAAIVVLVWMIIKWAFFSLYVANVARNSLYGGLGALPLFLIWLNLCWYLLLIGADIAYALSNRMSLEFWHRSGGNALLGPTELTLAACAVADAYGASEGPVATRALSKRLRIPEPAVRRLMTKLVEAGLVARVVPEGKSAAFECFLPARPPQTIPLTDLMNLGDLAPDNNQAGPTLLDAGMSSAIDQMQQLTRDAFSGKTLADLVSEKRK